MSKKVLIVGGVAGGASAAARLRRLDEKADIVIFEKGDYISFANCGLPYHIGGVIEERDRLLIQTPEAMWDRFKIDVRVRNEVLEIDRDKKEVLVENLEENSKYRESYDYLILSPGANPIVPPLPGLDRENVLSLRDIPDMDAIIEYVQKENSQRAVVVGGGFIGLEVAENLKERGLDVSVVEMADQVMGPLDYEMAAFVHNELRRRGVKLHLQDGIAEVKEENGESRVVLQSGREIPTDFVVLGIGVRPNVGLARDAGLELGVTGAIKVNNYLQTSDESIYALGDAIEVTDLVTGNPAIVPLAGPANKQGRIVADNIDGKKEEYEGTQGTAIAKIFDLAVASTGSNEKKLKAQKIDYQVSYTTSSSHASYYPGAGSMTIKIIFAPETGKLLGAQIVGYDGVDKRIDILAVAIRQGLCICDLQEMELAYAPPFGSAKDPVNMAGFTAGNIIDGLMVPALWNEIDDRDENTVLLDVRGKFENRMGQIEGSLNIPLNNLRDHLAELDKDQEIIIYCAVGLRGYIASRILLEHGFKNVKNLLGGYHLYNTVQKDREQTELPEEELVKS